MGVVPNAAVASVCVARAASTLAADATVYSFCSGRIALDTTRQMPWKHVTQCEVMADTAELPPSICWLHAAWWLLMTAGTVVVVWLRGATLCTQQPWHFTL